MILKLFLLTERFSVGKHTHRTHTHRETLILTSVLIFFSLIPIAIGLSHHTQNDSLKRFLKIDAHLSISYQNVLNKATTITTTTTAGVMRCS